MKKLLLILALAALCLTSCDKDGKNSLKGTKWEAVDDYMWGSIVCQDIYSLNFTSDTDVVLGYVEKEDGVVVDSATNRYIYVFSDPQIIITGEDEGGYSISIRMNYEGNRITWTVDGDTLIFYKK